MKNHTNQSHRNVCQSNEHTMRRKVHVNEITLV